MSILTNTTELEALLAKANALPEKEGASIETCSVSIECTNANNAEMCDVLCTCIDSATSEITLSEYYLQGLADVLTITCVRNTLLAISCGAEDITYEFSGEVYEYLATNTFVIFEVCGDGSIYFQTYDSIISGGGTD